MKLNCKMCNKEIEKFSCQIKKGEGKYCSKSCYTQSMKCIDLFKDKVRAKRPRVRVFIDCEVCGKAIETVPSKIGIKKYCSKSCYMKAHGVINKTMRYLRESSEYKAWRLSIYKRDSYKCQSCGLVGRNLNAHHIIPMSVDVTKTFSLDNGITLCVDCHRLAHKSYKPKCKQGELLGNLIEKISSQARRERLEGSQTREHGSERTMNPHECPASKDDDIVGALGRPKEVDDKELLR